MKRHGCWRRWARWLVAAGLLSGPGCMCYLHPLDSPSAVLAEPCSGVPKGARDHVYVFLVHGMDPLDYANLTGLRDFIQDLGFRNTYLGQLYHPPYLYRQILRVHQEDPDARFVLIGFSFGANMVRYLAQDMKAHDIPVDLLVYLGGNTLHNNDYDQPENVKRILNILASGAIWHGDTMDRAENIQVTDVWHFGSPTHPRTVELLSRELAVVAASVPVEVPADPEPEPETGPTPRPVTAQAPAHGEEWDFLKPVGHLSLLPGAAAAPAANPVPLPRPAPRATGILTGRTTER
jgi:hypothetical protein